MIRAIAHPRLLALAWLGAALVISGCGFKLRGEVEIPPDLNPLFIQAAAAFSGGPGAPRPLAWDPGASGGQCLRTRS